MKKELPSTKLTMITRGAIAMALIFVFFSIFKGPTNIFNALLIPITLYLSSINQKKKEIFTLYSAVIIFCLLFFNIQIFFIIFYCFISFLLIIIRENNVSTVLSALILTFAVSLSFLIAMYLTDWFLLTDMIGIIMKVLKGNVFVYGIMLIIEGAFVGISQLFISKMLYKRYKGDIMSDTIKSKIDFLRPNLPIIIKEINDRQYIIQPEFNRYGVKGMLHALDDAKNNLEYLFSAVEADSTLLFEQYNKWVNTLFINLKLPLDAMKIFYFCTNEVFKEMFDKGLIDEELFFNLNEYIDIGIEALTIEEQSSISYFQEDNPFKELLKKYSEFIFSGDKASAVQIFINISKSNVEIKDIYKYILQPFQLELGELWHEN